MVLYVGRESPLLNGGNASETAELPLILEILSVFEVGGMCHVAVKCIDMTQNTDREGSSLSRY